MKLVYLLLLAATPALAQDAGLKACRAIAEATARLACYDALPLANAAPAVVPPPSAEAPARPGGSFGLEAQQPKDVPDSVESSIDGRFTGWGPKTQIRLANGQVWQVTDGSTGVMNLDNPKVRVRRGVLGAFFLEFEKVGKSPRVRRIQ